MTGSHEFCWLCDSLLTEDDMKRSEYKYNKYLDENGTPPCEACFNHMIEVDLNPDECRN